MCQVVIFTSNGAIMRRDGWTDTPIHDWPKYRALVRDWLHEQLPPPYPGRLELAPEMVASLAAYLGKDAPALLSDTQ